MPVSSDPPSRPLLFASTGGIVCATIFYLWRLRRSRSPCTKLDDFSLRRLRFRYGEGVVTVQFQRGPSTVQRIVFHGDAIEWLKRHGQLPGSVVTSMPDITEFGGPTKMSVDEYCAWFTTVAIDVLSRTPREAIAIFYQTDFRRQGRWVDKSNLLSSAAQHVDATLLFHKIVCIAPPDTCEKDRPRPRYTHLVAYSRGLVDDMRQSTPDVLSERGHMQWVRAMGVQACKLSCEYIRRRVGKELRTVIDPFCGQGTVRAVANHLGMDAIGVEQNKERCRLAKNLVFDATALS